MPLPADAIRTGEAIALLAGKPLKPNSTPYIRHQGRLARGANRGRLTEYRRPDPGGVPRGPRYFSRAEVLALRDSLAADGFTAGAPSTYQRRAVEATSKHAKREGLVSIKLAAELAGVTVAAARKWTEKGRFGARKIDNRWFFVRAEVEAYRRPAAGQPPETVPCALHCGRSVKMTASRARRAREAAEEAGSDELLVFCSECWPTPEARRLAHSRRVWRNGYASPGRAAGIKRQWAEGKRDKEAHTERTSAGWRSPKRAVKQANASTQARYGHPLSDPTKVARAARRRAQASSERSQATRTLELKVIELWPTGATQMEIANEVRVTPQRLGQIARDQGLPPRPRGRRRKM